jgi:hypothetical protein
MRRLLLLVALALVGATVVAGHAAVRAQDATPTPGAATAGHPLLGAWMVDDPTGTPSVTAFTADGVVVDTETDGGVAIGSWAPTGPTTAAFTMVLPLTDPGFPGTVVIRATVEVAADGQHLTAPYSVTVVQPDGTVLFSQTGQVTGTRLPIEPVAAIGTPLAGFPTWTPEEPGGPATPEATPAG